MTSNLLSLAGSGAGDAWVSCQPNVARAIALVGGAGLFYSDDVGKSWHKLGTGAGSVPINHGPTSIVYDPLHPETTFWESGIYGSSFGVYKTTDDGSTFHNLGTLFHNDVVSVDFSDPARKTLLVGTHEQTRKLFLSRDGGATFNDIGANLPTGSSFSSAPHIIDAQTFLLGSSGWDGGAWGVYRSTNGGTSWTRASEEGAAGTPLTASDGTLYWLLANGGLIVSADKGATWKKAGSGPAQQISGPPVELPDGRIVALGNTNLVASSDHGSTWKPIGKPMPFPGANCQTYGVTYCPASKTFFINHNDCTGHLTNNAIWSAGIEE